MSRWRLRDDGERLRRVRLIHLEGTAERLDHQRAVLRREYAYALQVAGTQPSPELVELERRIRSVHAEWLGVVSEVRALKQENSP